VCRCTRVSPADEPRITGSCIPSTSDAASPALDQVDLTFPLAGGRFPRSLFL
jgi:hypothetical protein